VFDSVLTRVFTQALVVGVFGGAGLVLTQLYSPMAATVILAGRARRELLASGRPLVPGRIPWWAAPLLLTLLVAASAGAAYVSI
jgi:hypothetical protein